MNGCRQVSAAMVYSPCKNCENRRIGCHSGCEGYKRYCEEIKALRAVIKRENEYDAYMKNLHERNRWAELNREKRRRQKD